MKRLIMLAVLCAFVLSAAAASASELKANGYFKGDATWMNNWDYAHDNDGQDGDATRTFDIKQRTEINFEFIANENLKSVLTARIQTAWGRESAVIGSTDKGVVRLRQAYLDFMWPGTEVNVKVGYQGIALPNAVGGSILLDDRASALVVSSPLTDSFALTGAYIRGLSADDGAGQSESQIDLYALIADINATENIDIQPFIVIGNFGSNIAANASPLNTTSLNGTANEVDSAYWLGVSSTATVGGFGLAGDLNYGAVSGEKEADDRSGWALLLSADYAMDMFTPEAFFVYTTGEDDDATNGSERLPTVNQDWAVGSFFFGGEAWLTGSAISGDAPLGFWILGVSLKDIASFNEDMYHIVHVLYAKGTNDEKSAGLGNVQYGQALTEDDSVIEIDFNTYYKLYDELTLGLELGYAHLDADEDAWGSDADGGSAYKVSTGLKYTF